MFFFVLSICTWLRGSALIICYLSNVVIWKIGWLLHTGIIKEGSLMQPPILIWWFCGIWDIWLFFQFFNFYAHSTPSIEPLDVSTEYSGTYRTFCKGLVHKEPVSTQSNKKCVTCDFPWRQCMSESFAEANYEGTAS